MGDHKWPSILDQESTGNLDEDWISEIGNISIKIAIGLMAVLWLNFMMTP